MHTHKHIHGVIEFILVDILHCHAEPYFKNSNKVFNFTVVNETSLL